MRYVVDSSEKREKFVELANARVTRAIKDLQLIGNLANRRAYEYTESDVKQIIKALESEIGSLKDRFRSGSDRATGIFKLGK